tara:strand:+ start:137 stop:520 length:384 start_codon:yes stop_codon:yes gene_type:complete
MKIKVTLLPVAFDEKFNFLDERRNTLLIDGDSPIHRYIYSESVNECLAKLCESYLQYSYEWLDVQLSDFRRVSTEEFEVVYFSQFPFIENFEKAGEKISLSLNKEINEIEDYYVDIISRYGSRRFAP